MTVQCPACAARIMYHVAPNGRPFALDAEPAQDGTIFLIVFGGRVTAVHHESRHEAAQAAREANAPRYRLHCATCPNVGQHRRVYELG